MLANRWVAPLCFITITTTMEGAQYNIFFELSPRHFSGMDSQGSSEIQYLFCTYYSFWMSCFRYMYWIHGRRAIQYLLCTFSRLSMSYFGCTELRIQRKNADIRYSRCTHKCNVFDLSARTTCLHGGAYEGTRHCFEWRRRRIPSNTIGCLACVYHQRGNYVGRRRGPRGMQRAVVFKLNGSVSTAKCSGSFR